jgi:membrane fusion protein, multidrug efflux system
LIEADGDDVNAKLWILSGIVIAAAGIGSATYFHEKAGAAAAKTAPAPPQVVVSKPLIREVDRRLGFLGQFSAVERVELRAQVGGTLTEIHFKDGDIVHKGDLLFVIDSRPYEYRVAQTTAQLESATARLEFARLEFARFQTLAKTGAASKERAEQHTSDQLAAQAAVDEAKAQLRDAQFDLENCRITAPFTGRIGTHLVSIGNLIAGSRTATSPTTLLATIVSVDPIYLDFDMSEADYLAFSRVRATEKGAVADKVNVQLSDETDFSRQGTLDFVDNTLDRSSGTLHARATIANPDLLLTPGEFGRVRLVVGKPAPTLMIPDTAVLPDQSDHLVMTVTPDGTVAPKRVQVGDIRNGLRVIQSGLAPDDRVIIDGLPYARPGSKVDAQGGTIQYAAKGHE